HEPGAARHHHHGAGDRDVAAERAGLISRTAARALRQHSGRLDLEPRLRLHKAADLDHRHRRKVPPHDLAIGGAERGKLAEILIHVTHVPGQAHDVPRRGAGFFEYRGDVGERLFRLRDEPLGETAAFVLADHAADEYYV